MNVTRIATMVVLGTQVMHRAPALPTGDWAGVIDIAGHQGAVQAHLSMRGDSATGSMDLYGDATGVTLRGVRLTGDSIVATIPLRLTGPTTIRGRIIGDTL